ncbi:MAG: hypothetical protein ACI8QZ_002415 [Chlamydiales bacterium]|jgi:hypothetical protein
MTLFRFGLMAVALAGAPFSSPLWADTLSGHVQDVGAAGVAGVNIDVEDMITGDPVTIFNGGTDINGDFLLSAPSGLYRVIFTPPAPPTTTHLVTMVENVFVSGASAMGTVQLLPGVSLSGRLVTSGGVPTPPIDLDFIDPGTGDELVIPGDNSGAIGSFLVAVPAGPLEMEVRPSQGASPLYAPRRIELNLMGNTALGDLVVENGFFLCAVAERSNGNPVSGGNADVFDTSTGEELFTPGDGTDADGFVDVVVPAGILDLEICPPNGSMLVGARAANVAVASDTDVGVITLVNGVVLSGQLLSADGMPVASGDIDVRDSSSQVAVVTCNDNTNGAGNYAVIVPIGVFDVYFSMPADPSVGIAKVRNVNISGATTVDGRLPGCLCTRYCNALPNSGGTVASISGNGSTVSGDQSFQLVVRDLPGNVPGLFFFGPNQIQAPFGEGRRCVGGSTKRIQPPAFGMNGGTAQRFLNFTTPTISDSVIMGANLNFQFWYRDQAGGPNGFNLSDGLNVIWQ